jgi:hypothetical protein
MAINFLQRIFNKPIRFLFASLQYIQFPKYRIFQNFADFK